MVVKWNEVVVWGRAIRSKSFNKKGCRKWKLVYRWVGGYWE